MAVPGEKTTAQLVPPVGPHRAVSGLRADQVSANKHGSARSVTGLGEEPAQDHSEVGGDGNYACTCGKKGFSGLFALKRHIKEATEAREHACPICRRKFKRPDHMRQHLRGHHKKSSDEIRDLLAAQRLQLRRESGPAITTTAAAVPRTGSAGVQAGFDHPGGAVEVVPGGSWSMPMRVSATAAPVAQQQAGASRPGQFSSSSVSVLPAAHGLEHVATAFAPQSLTTQDQGLAAYDSAYPAATAAAEQCDGPPTNYAPGSVDYPALSGGDLGYFNQGAASVTVGPADGGLSMTAPDNSFMGYFYGFGLDNFDG